jgi:hypothetical protein
MNLIAVIKPYWKCLQNLNDNDESIHISKYLENWDEKFRKNIKFYSNANRPEEFDLTGFYPLYTDEENQALDIQIDALIKNTDLTTPDRRTIIYQESDCLTDTAVLAKCSKLASRSNENVLFKLIETLNSKKVS